jgi:hypothetical protein
VASALSGRVTFLNGVAASGVEVRVFDRDSPGKADDDLTITPGFSDDRGYFQVVYDPGRYMDFARLPFIGLGGSSKRRLSLPDLLDIYSPYLQFRYMLDGQERTYTDALELFEDRFQLPESVSNQFRPSQHGFQFNNAFSGYMLPFSVPFLSDGKVSGVYGLCGGMSAAAADFLLYGRKIPPLTEAPRRGTKFHRYLFRRAIDSFALGESILRFARWMLLPEDGINGTWRLTLTEWEKLRVELDQQRLVPLGQLRAKAANLQEISRRVWDNHQVLAYGYTAHPGGSFDIHIYDPNCRCDDNVFIHLERVQAGEEDGEPVYGLTCYESDCWEKHRPLYGLFVMPYEPVEPPSL